MSASDRLLDLLNKKDVSKMDRVELTEVEYLLKEVNKSIELKRINIGFQNRFTQYEVSEYSTYEGGYNYIVKFSEYKIYFIVKKEGSFVIYSSSDEPDKDIYLEELRKCRPLAADMLDYFTSISRF